MTRNELNVMIATAVAQALSQVAPIKGGKGRKPADPAVKSANRSTFQVEAVKAFNAAGYTKANGKPIDHDDLYVNIRTGKGWIEGTTNPMTGEFLAGGFHPVMGTQSVKVKTGNRKGGGLPLFHRSQVAPMNGAQPAVKPVEVVAPKAPTQTREELLAALAALEPVDETPEPLVIEGTALSAEDEAVLAQLVAEEAAKSVNATKPTLSLKS